MSMPADIEATLARIDARRCLINELDRLAAARDKAQADAAITLKVAIDYECARGLRRKTRTGYDLTPTSPRDALRRIDQALTDYHTACGEHRSAIDAKLAEIQVANDQYRADNELIRQWIERPAAAVVETLAKMVGQCQCSTFPMARGVDDCPNHIPDTAPTAPTKGGQ